LGGGKRTEMQRNIGGEVRYGRKFTEENKALMRDIKIRKKEQIK
jgi:hypothetical protein